MEISCEYSNAGRDVLLWLSGQAYAWSMGMYSTGDKLRMSLWILLLRVLFVVAVLVTSLVSGASVFGALLLVSCSLLAWRLVMIWTPPAEHRRRASGPPGHPSGDRFPRRPLSPSPSLPADRPEPGSCGLPS